MPITTDGKNEGLDALAALADYAALFSDDAATTEISGGTPAYARKALTWGAASGGVVAITNEPEFDVPAGATVRAVGFMTLLTGGVLLAYHNVTDESFGAQGTYTLTAASMTLSDPA